MTTNNSTPGSVNQNPAARGDGSDADANSNSNANPDSSTDLKDPKKDPVAYDTHRRLLDEKKKVQEERDQLRRDKEEREKRELEQQGKLKELLELEKKRAEDAENRFKSLNNSFAEARKLNAVLKVLDIADDDRVSRLIDLSGVSIDSETHEIDSTSVAKVAEAFKSEWPELLKKKSGPVLPAAAPAGNNGGTISRSEWKKLSSKEMLKYKPNQILGD